MRRQIQVALLLLAACTKGGAADAGQSYALHVELDGRVRLLTASGYHVNDDYPVSYTSDGGRLSLKDSLDLTPCVDDAPHSCAMQLKVPPQNGVLAFSVCSADQCLIEKVPIAKW